MVANSVEQLCERQKTAGIRVMERGERNHVAFHNSRKEIIVFTQRPKQYLRRKVADTRIMVRDHTLGFNTEATGWLRVYLNTGLQFQAHNSLWLEKARKAEDRVRRLVSTNGLEPGLIRRIQVAAVQSVALYIAEL